MSLVHHRFLKSHTDGVNPTPCVSSYDVTVPCIRNTEDIPDGVEVVLQWGNKKAGAKNDDSKKRVISAFIANAPKMRKKQYKESLRTACCGSAG